MLKTKKFLLFLSAVLLILTVPACKSANSVNIAFFPNITHAQGLYGMTMGSYDSIFGEDKYVDWYSFNAGPSEMEAMRSGSIDIGYIGPIPAISGYVSTGNVTIIAGATNSGSTLVVRKDSGITDIKSLQNKTVAVPQFGNTQDIILRMLLDENGFASTEDGGNVEIIQQANANIKSLIENGDIDAALVPEPWGSRLAIESGAEILLDSNEILSGNYPVAVVVVRTDFLNENRELVKAFLREHINITDKLNSDAKSCLGAVNQTIGSLTGVRLDDGVLTASLTRINYDYNINEAALESFITLYSQFYDVPGTADFSKLCDFSLLEEILAE